MTKQHFIALADALRAMRPSEREITILTGEYAQWKRDVEAVAQVCLGCNPRFNYQTFMGYLNGTCGPNGGAVKGKAA
jgi:hypothetical protein